MANIILLSSFLESTIEHWRAIEGFPGYEISSLGRVRSFWQKTGANKRWGYYLGRTPQVAMLQPDKDGYLSKGLRRDGKDYCRRVHRLVAQAFIPNDRPAIATKVNHKNNIPGDNRVENLEWCTEEENREHALGIGVWPRGERHWKARLNAEKVKQIRMRRASGESNSQIAKDFGITKEAVSAIYNRRIWKNVP